jgi:hypothetical protein
MKACKNLKGTSISISDDNTPEERKARSELFKKMKDAMKQNPSATCKINPDRLIIRCGTNLEIWKYDHKRNEVVKAACKAPEQEAMDHQI